MRIRGWVAVLAAAGFVHGSCALAQIYKCTDADGRTAFSDKPCATEGASAGKDGAKQEVLRQPRLSAPTSADSIAAMCAKSEGSKPADEVIKSLPEAQQKAVVAALRGLIAGAGVARDRGAQENLKRVTL